MTPEAFYITYDYIPTRVPSYNLNDLDKWRQVCLVGVQGHNHTFYMDGEALKSWPWHLEPLLPPGGALVLGQDQDTLMGGYSTGQAFSGRLTEVNAWSRALTPTEVQRQGHCQEEMAPEGDWISWSDAPWKPQGQFRVHSKGPCQENANNLMFFNIKLPLHEAFILLRIMQITPFLPKDQRDVDNLRKLMITYGKECDHEAVSNRTVWINALYNPDSMQWEKGDTGERLSFHLNRRKRTYESKTGSLQVSDNTWITDDAENENCFAGIKPQNVQVFRLQGFTEKGSYYPDKLTFILSQSEKNYSFYFKGIRNLSIEHFEGSWRLLGLKENKVLATSTSTKLPIGRLPWIVRDEIKNLSLSSCSSRQFVCDDGSCISMTRRCDLVSDCKDWSDERTCDLVDLPPGHINILPPIQDIQVRTLIYLDVITVDLLDMSLVLDLKMELFWNDPNVRYRNLRSSLRTNQIHNSGGEYPLWIPEIEVEPLRGFPTRRHTLMVYRMANGTIEEDSE